jgi:hypothetical protein
MTSVRQHRPAALLSVRPASTSLLVTLPRIGDISASFSPVSFDLAPLLEQELRWSDYRSATLF